MMISMYHQTQKFHHNHLHPVQHSPTHPTPLTYTYTDANTSTNPSPNDDATIEIVRRPRGRPPGSKNKPKPTVIITQNAEPSMSPYILELPPGVDVIETITTFCRKRKMGLCVLNGNGAVSNVTFKQPSTAVTFHGRFDIISLSATINISDNLASGFAISLAGSQGQVVGGLVVGPLVSAGSIYLICATFNTPSFHRLPMELEDDSVSQSPAQTEYSYKPSDHAARARQPPPSYSLWMDS